MSDPTVACVMLTADRPQAMIDRAVRCFLKQTYVNKSLLVFDSGTRAVDVSGIDVNIAHHGAQRGSTIGALRNAANEITTSEVIAHWDSDDWSHPYRLAEQVDLLCSSQVDAVGYHEMLFWREDTEEAWLYQNAPRGSPHYALGTSLCYWRQSWKRRPFPERNRGEDQEFIYTVKTLGRSSIYSDVGSFKHLEHPRMVATIHAGNGHQQPYASIENNECFKRVPYWDSWISQALANPVSVI